MINNFFGCPSNGKPPLRPRVHQVVQVNYRTANSYRVPVENTPESMLRRHTRTGSNSTTLIRTGDQFLPAYSSPTAVTLEVNGGWLGVRSTSINTVGQYPQPQQPNGFTWREPKKRTTLPANRSPLRCCPRRLQSQIMGGSCISKPSNKSKPPQHNKVAQTLPREEPVVIVAQQTRTYHLSTTLLDSDEQEARESECQPAYQPKEGPQERVQGVMDRVNLGYYPFSEDSYDRHMEKILETARLGGRINWHKQMDEVVRMPQEQLLARLLELHQQFFKWYAYTIVAELLAVPELELFHQELHLTKEIADLLRKNIKEERGRSGKPAIQTSSTYSPEQLRKGVWVGGLHVKMLSYGGYTELRKTYAAEATTFYNLCDLRQVRLEVIGVFRGCYFQVSVPRSRPETGPDRQWKAPCKYIRAEIPVDMNQPISYKFSQEEGSKIIRRFQEKRPEFTRAEKWKKSTYSGVLLSQPKSSEQINARAGKLCSFVGGANIINGKVYFVAKRQIHLPNKSALEQFDRIKHLIQTHRMLDDACSRLGLSVFDLLRFRDKNRLRPILMTSALAQGIRYLYMDTFTYQSNDELYQLIKELLSFEMTMLKEKLFLYLNLQLLFAEEQQNHEIAQQVLGSPHWHSVQFFQALYHEFGVDMDSLVLKIKKDSTYLTYNMSEFRPSSLNYNLLLKQSISMRDIVLMLLLKCLKEQESTGLVVENRQIRLGIYPQCPKLNLPVPQVLESWCREAEFALRKVRSVNGEQAEILIPFIVKLAVEIVLKLPFQQTLRRAEMHFNALAHCSPELIISFMSLMALASEVYDKVLSQQYYIRTLALMHRMYCEPRARNNTNHPWEVFLTARLLNMKRMAGKEYEAEYLAQLMECMMGDSISERPHQPKNPGPTAYPFPTIAEQGSKPFPISLANLLQWILSNIPAATNSDLLFKKSDVSKNDMNRSNLSTESRSTASKKEKPLHDFLEKNEATINKETYLGIIVIGNGRRHISVYWPLKNLIVHKVACGISHTIVSTLDELYGWGQNDSGQIGELPGEKIRKICNIDTVATKLSCGSEHSCAIISGRLRMWGQKGGGITSGDGYAFDDVSCGGLHTIALKDGEVYSWGRGEGGQLGHPLNILQTKQGAESTQYFLSQPRKIKGLSRIKKVACGDAHTLALTEEGAVYVFGFSYQGQLGLGLTGQSQLFQIFEPIRLDFFGSTKVIDLAAGSTYSVFVTERREIFSCGLNDFHQIGIDTAVTVVQKRKNRSLDKDKKHRNGQLEFAVPNRLDYFSDSFDVKKLVCGENHTIACVDYNGQQLYVGWGMNKHQQLGLEYCVSTTPRTIANLQRAPITEICCGNTFTLALTGSTGDRISLRRLIAESTSALAVWTFKRL